MKAVTVLILALVAVSYTKGEHDHKELFAKIEKTCVEQGKLSAEDLEKIKKMEIPESQAAKCIGACILEQLGVMKNGELIEEASDALIEKKYAGNDEKIKKSKEEAKKCGAEVDEKKITDKCEVAHVVLKCLMKTDLMKP